MMILLCTCSFRHLGSIGPLQFQGRLHRRLLLVKNSHVVFQSHCSRLFCAIKWRSSICVSFRALILLVCLFALCCRVDGAAKVTARFQSAVHTLKWLLVCSGILWFAARRRSHIFPLSWKWSIGSPLRFWLGHWAHDYVEVGVVIGCQYAKRWYFFFHLIKSDRVFIVFYQILWNK